MGWKLEGSPDQKKESAPRASFCIECKRNTPSGITLCSSCKRKKEETRRRKGGSDKKSVTDHLFG